MIGLLSNLYLVIHYLDKNNSLVQVFVFLAGLAKEHAVKIWLLYRRKEERKTEKKEGNSFTKNFKNILRKFPTFSLFSF